MIEYKVTRPELPPGATSPVMDSRDLELWLNQLGSQDWRLVSYGAKHWQGAEPFVQEWWIFYRER